MSLGLEWDDASLLFSCQRCGYGPLEEDGCPNCKPATSALSELTEHIDQLACPICGGEVEGLVCKCCGWDEYGGNIFVTTWSERQAKRAAS